MPEVKTERVLKFLIVLCLGLLAYVIATTLREPVVNVGDTAPPFTITADNGRTISRSDFGGRLLVLNFWATWCPPCVEEIPSLDQFQKTFAANGVVVLGISVDRSTAAYEKFLRRSDVSFLTARDPEGLISARYGTFKYPETYIIDRSGKVVEKLIGPANWTDPQIVSRVRTLLERT